MFSQYSHAIITQIKVKSGEELTWSQAYPQEDYVKMAHVFHHQYLVNNFKLLLMVKTATDILKIAITVCEEPIEN
jgi:hypothetical protein